VFHRHHHPDSVAARVDRLMAGVLLRDDTERMAQLSANVSADFVYVTPSGVFDGAEGLSDAFSHYRHDDWLHTAIARVTPVEVHHGYFRYLWQRMERGVLAMEGCSFGQVDDEGLLERIISFDGKVPGLDPEERSSH
jgi:hypothetical protein